jgi:hypothetical protein
MQHKKEKNWSPPAIKALGMRRLAPPITVKGVRQPRKLWSGVVTSEAAPSPLAHHSNGLLIQLNPDWRIVEDDLQYILQQRKGSRRLKATGWASRSFCRTREALLRCMREYCGRVDQTALQQVSTLPDWHPDEGEVGRASAEDQEVTY